MYIYDLFICIVLYFYIYNIIYIYIYLLTNLGSDVKIFKLLQTKPNQTVFFLLPNLSKNFQPESTCAVCSKLLSINDLAFPFLIKNLCKNV